MACRSCSLVRSTGSGKTGARPPPQASEGRARHCKQLLLEASPSAGVLAEVERICSVQPLRMSNGPGRRAEDCPAAAIRGADAAFHRGSGTGESAVNCSKNRPCQRRCAESAHRQAELEEEPTLSGPPAQRRCVEQQTLAKCRQ